MNPETVKTILISVACIAITIALAVWLVAHFKLVKLKGEIQEDLANTYEPEILGAKCAEKKEVKEDGEPETPLSPDSPGADGSSQQAQP